MYWHCYTIIDYKSSKVSSGANSRYTKPNDQCLLVGFCCRILDWFSVGCIHLRATLLTPLSHQWGWTATDASWTSPWQQRQRLCPPLPPPKPPHHPLPPSFCFTSRLVKNGGRGKLHDPGLPQDTENKQLADRRETGYPLCRLCHGAG